MKIGILTFQFPYNYGAMLQAYSLKTYLCSAGFETYIIPYYPQKFRSQYSVNPFDKNISLRHRMGALAHFYLRKPQADLFDEFKLGMLYKSKTIEIANDLSLREYVKGQKYDYLLFGSDQIWNTDINHEDSSYFGDGLDGKKISYAASIGNNKINETQKDYILKFLPSFKAISVREPDSQNILSTIGGLKSEVVCDPVFLRTKADWKEDERQIDISKPFILVYELQDNIALTQLALDEAKKKDWDVYSIHPTNGIYPRGTIPLKKVGPREFLYLVDHAKVICTNSFHCVAFSLIFNKPLLHIPNSHSPERTVSLLKRVGVESIDGRYIVKASDYNLDKLNKFIQNSKYFLNTALQEKMDRNNNNEID